MNKARSLRNINIVYWNANGLPNKVIELPNFLATRNIDILLISESKLNANIHCNIYGYRCYRKDRDGNTRGGGVAIYIRWNIPHTEIQIPTTSSLEAHGVILENNILIVSCYLPPKATVDTKELNKILDLP